MNAFVKPPSEYAARNETAFRRLVEDEFANTHRKDTDLIIPHGLKLGFNGTGGEQVTLQYDSGAFKIVIDGLTVVELGTASSITTLADRVTTAEGEIDTAQSAIITNAASISTVDGKLSASYALTVDGNGRIAQMKLLSNGSTSSVKFLATTFSIYDGTSDVATFEVSGGSLYVAGNKVRTESLVANAVTQGVIDEEDSETTATTSWTALADVSITVPDAATLVKVDWSIYVSTTGEPEDDLEIRIKRGSTVIYETVATRCPPMVSFFVEPDQQFDIPIQVYGQFSGFDSDSPGAGSYTYYLEARGAGGNWGISKRRLFAMKFIR